MLTDSPDDIKCAETLTASVLCVSRRIFTFRHYEHSEVISKVLNTQHYEIASGFRLRADAQGQHPAHLSSGQ